MISRSSNVKWPWKQGCTATRDCSLLLYYTACKTIWGSICQEVFSKTRNLLKIQRWWGAFFRNLQVKNHSKSLHCHDVTAVLFIASHWFFNVTPLKNRCNARIGSHFMFSRFVENLLIQNELLRGVQQSICLEKFQGSHWKAKPIESDSSYSALTMWHMHFMSRSHFLLLYIH